MPRPPVRSDNIRIAILGLLEQRQPGATICPSETARLIADAASEDRVEVDWRGVMPDVHTAVDQMLREGLVSLSWKGKSVYDRAGPYRIGRGPNEVPAE